MAEPAPDPQLPPRPAATPLDPTRPDSFPRRVLLCVVGLTPQVVTETLWALAVDAQPPFVPTELSIVTTSEGADRVDLVLTSGKQKLDALAADYPGRGLEGLARRTTVHVVRDEAGAALADIASLEANTALADLLVEVVRNLTDDTTSAVHLSIAGGRKTMGFLAGYALSLYGRPQDRLSHVLVDPAFEQHADFFYPPPEPVVLLSQSKDQKPIRTDRCGLVLADIPFVRLREGLPGDLLEGRASFAATVASLQERFRPPELVIDLERRSVRAHGR
ncbi:MAG: CRISPR-associated ring nuclease Csm6, partial [Geminicoccaceae bacterium]|nr:CRISPR-associated ring nuclease Csm6 [Geminicoccaceae bacterium]